MLSAALTLCLAAHVAYSLRQSGRIRRLEVLAHRLDRKVVPFRR